MTTVGAGAAPKTQPGPKRLAITIAGAVSLGSYEAGVMWEVLDAIAQHNLDPQTRSEDRIIVDVVTGASAGGMTGIILAQKLMYEGHTFADPYENPLYNCWVKRISLKELQNVGAGEPATHSLLSSDLIVRISEEALMARYAAGVPPPRVPHPAIDPNSPFRVGVALTNLDGVDYEYKVQPHGVFGYRQFVDQRSRKINPLDAQHDTRSFWEPLREAAVACGAFPFAFRPQQFARSAKHEHDDFPKENLVKWPSDPRDFTYTDGGVLQNQPLGMAKNLVDQQDEHLDQERRFYLFVSPHEKDPGTPSAFRAANADYLHFAAQLVETVVGQAGFRDWIRADSMNQLVNLMDLRAEGLCKGIVDGNVEVNALRRTADSILSLLFPVDTELCAPGAKTSESRIQAQQRIEKQYASELRSLAGIPGAASAFRDSMLAFETAAGLGARDTMQIYGITSTSRELAGASLQAFLGFFDMEYRQHDYDVGRTKAQKTLQQLRNGLGPIRYQPSPIRKLDSKLAGISYKDVKEPIKRSFRSHLVKRVGNMILEHRRPKFLWRPLAWLAEFLTWIVLHLIK